MSNGSAARVREPGGWVRGLSTAQLNHDLQYPVSQTVDNQLRTWDHLEILRPRLRAADLPKLPRALPQRRPPAKVATCAVLSLLLQDGHGRRARNLGAGWYE